MENVTARGNTVYVDILKEIVEYCKNRGIGMLPMEARKGQ